MPKFIFAVWLKLVIFGAKFVVGDKNSIKTRSELESQDQVGSGSYLI